MKKIRKRKEIGICRVAVREQAKAAIAALIDKEDLRWRDSLERGEQKEQEKSNNFRSPMRDFRGSGGANEGIDGNKW